MTRITLFMLPVCFAGALVLVSQGVPQTPGGAVPYAALNGGASQLCLGPAASQIIIKQFFTNGGGFYGADSAYPFENPTALSNLPEMLCMLWIPVELCFTFGAAIKNRFKDNGGEDVKTANKNRGVTRLKAMSVIFLVCLAVCTACEFAGAALPDGVAGIGNMEGKEVRFGIGGSSLWAVATTSASNGSVNAMHDSFTPIGGMIPLFLLLLARSFTAAWAAGCTA